MELILDMQILKFFAIAFILSGLACFLALYAFHALTKGNHLRGWNEFEPLNYNIPIRSYKDLRMKSYETLQQIIANRFDCEKRGEDLVYAVIRFYSPEAKPNSKIDNDDINFSINCLDIIQKINSGIAIKELHSDLCHKFPNWKFYI